MTIPPKYVIIGHSERRREFGEDNKMVLKKAQNLWELEVIPVICFDLPEMDELSEMLRPFQDRPMVLAYEPVAAISTSGQGGNLNSEILEGLMPKLRVAFFGKPIIYGGSVKAENAQDYNKIVSGLLVGGASLKAESFYQIVQGF
jgi:triosephosphate isomerase